jgi:tetratricopeptide (TPR) repeat protein
MSQYDKPVRAALVLALCVLTAIASAAHWRALQSSFHLDDFFRATNNPAIEVVSPISRHFVDPSTMATLPQIVQYRPLLPLTLSLSHAAGERLGIDPVIAHHAGNLLLHLVAVWLIFFLTRALLRARDSDTRNSEAPNTFLCFATAALFAAHPVAGVAVNYVSNRDLLLALVFILGALIAYLRIAERPSLRAWVICGLCLLGGLLSKQNAALFPLIALIYELTLGRRNLRDPVLWRRVGLLTLFVGAYLAFVRYGIGFSDADQLVVARAPYEYPLTELRLHLFYYAKNLIWPLSLHPLPQIEAASLTDPKVLFGALFIAFSLSAAWRSARSRPLIAFAIFAYFAWLSMTSSVIPMRSFAEDYRQLISLPFACLLGGSLLCALPKAARYPSLGALCLLLIVSSNSNARHWETEETLWGRAVELGTSSQGHLNYGRSIAEKDPTRAEAAYRHALELNPHNAYAKINLAILLIQAGDVEGGLVLAREAASDNPRWGVTQHWLARALVFADRDEEAITHAARAHDLEPTHIEYRDLLVELLYRHARELQVAGDVESSMPHLEKLHRIVDSFSNSHYLHGWVHQSRGANAEAAAQYREQLRGDPSHLDSRYNLAHALRDLGEKEQAKAELRTLLSYSPAHTQAASLLSALED